MANDKWIAMCYLQQAGDERNKCYYNKSELFVITHGREFRIKLEQVDSIFIKNKLLLLPVILGGLIASLGMVAFFQNLYYSPYLLFLILAGILLFYFGMNGLPAFVIRSGNYENHFILWKKTGNLNAFTDYLSFFLKGNDDQSHLRSFFIPMNNAAMELLKVSGVALSNAPVFPYSKLNNIEIPFDFLIEIDPLEISVQITFLYNLEGILKPQVNGHLKIEDVKAVYNDIPK